METSATQGNPVLPVHAADPHAEQFGDRYYIYATNAGIYASTAAFCEKVDDEEHGFAAWSSTDLRNWNSEGRIIRFGDFEWAKDLGDAWAPCIAERNGRYYFYFCAKSRMGVAVGDTPIGPFKDAIGSPLVDFRDDMSAIDPMVFTDDDGSSYFYWGAVPGSWLAGRGFEIRDYLSMCRLNNDMVSFASEEIPTIVSPVSPGGNTDTDHIEASHVFKRNGVYYLMWSRGSFSSNDESKAYRVEYATAETPLGPWKVADNNPVLSTNRELNIVGPGHHSTIQIPGTDIWYCIYHCHPGDVNRRVYIDRMTFDDQGRIEKIEPTLEGPDLQPIQIEVTCSQFGPYPKERPIRFQARLLHGAEAKTGVIEFFSGNFKIGETSVESATFDWSAHAPGFHRITARATLTSGEIVTSSPLNMDVE